MTSCFLSTLSLRRATATNSLAHAPPQISIHALLAESDSQQSPGTTRTTYFYPRSPCGERQSSIEEVSKYVVISIHALLAESDDTSGETRRIFRAFLSTLSLRRATDSTNTNLGCHRDFYPRSPCGERHTWQRGSRITYVISIHALLAESDSL